MTNHWLGPDSSKWIEVALEPVLQEPRQSVIARERSTFDRLAAPDPLSIVLFGAGALGKAALKNLRHIGVEPLAFADNRPHLWGKDIEGVPVFSPVEATQNFRFNATFVVTIYNGTSVREQLYKLGCKFIVPFAPLFWKYAEIFFPEQGFDLPHRIQEHVDDVRAGYAVLTDNASKREFCEQIRWRFLLDYSCLSPALNSRFMYFPPDLVKSVENEVLVDCGAYDGDSIQAFIAIRGSTFRRIFALEPDPVNREALTRYLAQLPNDISSHITILPFAVGDCVKTIAFCASGTGASSMMSGISAQYIECRPLDELFAEEVPTYIKMDIEAAEPDAIRGAKALLSTHIPVVAACVYHRCEHLWEIPLLLKQASEQYSIFLRRYAEESWEMVCYAIPQSRIL